MFEFEFENFVNPPKLEHGSDVLSSRSWILNVEYIQYLVELLDFRWHGSLAIDPPITTNGSNLLPMGVIL